MRERESHIMVDRERKRQRQEERERERKIELKNNRDRLKQIDETELEGGDAMEGKERQ